MRIILDKIRYFSQFHYAECHYAECRGAVRLTFEEVTLCADSRFKNEKHLNI
jgi:hypothetical protein